MKNALYIVFILFLIFLFLSSCSRLPPPSGISSPVSSGGTTGGTSGGTSGGTTGGTSGGTSGGTTGGTSGGTITTVELFSVATSVNGQFGVAVGAGGTILQATSTGSSSSNIFPAWTSATSPTSNNLRGVAFDTNSGTGSAANVLAVGDAGVFLENTSSGSGSWSLGSSSGTFTLQDAQCAGTTAPNFTANLFGAAVFSNSNQPAVAVGGPFTDSCARSKGIIAVSTSSAGAFPYNGWQLVNTYGPGAGTIFPAVTFRGVSYAQRASASPFVVVVGDSGNIFVGTVASGLQNGTSWAINSTSPSTASTFNSAAIGSDNSSAIAVGNGILYVNSNIGSTTTWSSLSIPGTITPANYTSVHFTTGSTLTAIVVGSSPPQILLVGNCCNSSSSVTNVTPSISGLSNLDGVWGGVGPPGGLGLASGAGGFILENDNGGAGSTSWTRVH